MDIQKIQEYKSAFDLIAKNIKDDDSPFVGTFMPEEHRNASGAYQGAKYFSYNGKVLDEIRKEFESRSTSL